MTRRIVVTGANSYLGHHTIKHLAKVGAYEIVALCSPRAAAAPADAVPGTSREVADLAKPVGEEIARHLNAADRVLHFAWDRRCDASGENGANEAMVENVMRHCSPEAFVFVSSVAGSPEARSQYGRNKHAVARQVLAKGGSVFVPGLVTDDDPQGPFKLLASTVRGLPVAFRLSQDEPNVYPVELSTLLEMLAALCAGDLRPGTYNGFTRPVGFNAFLADLEQRYPRRRIPVRVPTPLVLSLVGRARLLPTPAPKYCDKILTFLYKDDAHLMQGAPVPGFGGTSAIAKDIRSA